MTKIVSVGGLAMTWDGIENPDGVYHAWSADLRDQPSVSAIVVERGPEWPIATGAKRNPRGFTFFVRIVNLLDVEDAHRRLFDALDTSQTAKAIIISDDDGNNARYMYCNFQTREEHDESRGSGAIFAVTAVAVDDPYWRAIDGVTEAIYLSASVQSLIVTNNGHLDAWPEIALTPTGPKTGGKWQYRRFVPRIWQAAAGVTNYPTQLWSADTTGLTPDKAIDETSVGVFVDGIEVDRWFGGENGQAGGFDSATTKLWANLDWQPGLVATLAVTIPNTLAWANEVRVAEDISAWPESGLILIDDEVFRYRRKDNERRRFLDVSREYGAALETHFANVSAVYWLQHEIFIAYSPATGLAKPAEFGRKPLIDMGESDNLNWVWKGDFGSAVHPGRPGQWRSMTTLLPSSESEVFTGDEIGAESDPYDVMGIKSIGKASWWQFDHPGWISDFDIDVEMSGTGSVSATVMVSNNGGTTWKAGGGQTLNNPSWGTATVEPAGTLPFRMNTISLWKGSPNIGHAIQAVEVKLHFVGGSVVASNNHLPEQANYSLDMTIINETTGESIRLDMPVGLSIYDRLFINAEEHTVGRLTDEIDRVYYTNLYRIMTKNDRRLHMLRLVSGGNLLRFVEDGLSDMDAAVTFTKRMYF